MKHLHDKKTLSLPQPNQSSSFAKLTKHQNCH